MAPTQHTVRSYDTELEQVDRHILAMGGLVEAQLRGAMEALVEGDREIAQRVIESDAQIDEHEHQADELVTRVIALRQPMAEDLRRVKTGLKVAANLERELPGKPLAGMDQRKHRQCKYGIRRRPDQKQA